MPLTHTHCIRQRLVRQHVAAAVTMQSSYVSPQLPGAGKQPHPSSVDTCITDCSQFSASCFSGSRRTEAPTSYWMRTTPTAWRRTSGRTTPSSPPPRPHWTATGSACTPSSASWAASCSPRATSRWVTAQDGSVDVHSSAGITLLQSDTQFAALILRSCCQTWSLSQRRKGSALGLPCCHWADNITCRCAGAFQHDGLGCEQQEAQVPQSCAVASCGHVS